MWVKVTTNLGSGDYPETPFLEGEVHEVTDAQGAVLVARGHAAEVENPNPAPPEPQPDKFEAMRAENINPPQKRRR